MSRAYDLDRFKVGERWRWPSKHRDSIMTVTKVTPWSCGKNGEVSFKTDAGRAVCYTFGQLSIGKLTSDSWVKAPDPICKLACDLCLKTAVWFHPAGGQRCNICPRPLK